MVHILEGNSETVAHVKENMSFLKKNVKFVTALANVLNRSNYRFHSTDAHLFLSYHLICKYHDCECRKKREGAKKGGKTAVLKNPHSFLLNK